jgi:hypothetical protein
MTSIDSLALEVPDPVAANAFYTAAFGLGAEVGLRASEAPTNGFRGFTVSLVVSQPATVDAQRSRRRRPRSHRRPDPHPKLRCRPATQTST